MPLLLTLSSGVKGLTTIHAGSARQALTRLRFICQLADTSSELPMSALSALVSEAVDVVVHCTRTGDRVQVSEVVAVEELQTGRDSIAFTVTELFRRDGPGAPLAWTGNLPARASRPLEMAGYDVRELLGARVAGAPAVGLVPDGDDRGVPPVAPMVERVRKVPPAAGSGRSDRGLFGARRR